LVAAECRGEGTGGGKRDRVAGLALHLLAISALQ
jgi:hypothetical protein